MAKPATSTTDINSSVSGNSMRNSAIAGYAAGSCGVILGHPLDSLKVWLQTGTQGKNKHFVSYTSSSSVSSSVSGQQARIPSSVAQTTMLKRTAPLSTGSVASMSTLVARGETASSSLSASYSLRHLTSTVRALYSGVGPPLISVGIVQSINFAIYDTVRRILHKRDSPSAHNHNQDYLKNDSIVNCGIAGFVAGSGLAFITSPLITIKCRQQITGNGFHQTARNALYGSDGKLSMRRCFVGFAPHYISEAWGRAIYYTVYEACKRSIASNKEQQGLEGYVTLQERMMSAGLAGIVCWAFIFPMDTLRSRVCSQDGPRSLSTIQMARQIAREGVFYRGFLITVLRAGPVAGAVLPVYDLCLEKLSSSSS